MDIHQLNLALRPRSDWEAIDVGFLLTQRTWRTAWLIWFSLTLPWFLCLNLISPPWVGYLLLWWGKPFYDRVLLLVFSRAVFGETLSVRQAWAALPGLCWRSGLLWSLTLGRFALARSYYLPLRVLEGARGKTYRSRRAALSRDGSGTGVWLTVICIHLEAVLTLALVMLVVWLAPANVELSFEDFSSSENTATVTLSFCCDYLALSLMEPFYVAAGFSLYLNRRTWLEGWDIELAFHRLAARLAGAAPLLLLACLGLPLSANPVDAAEVRVLAPEEECAPRPAARDEVERALAQVLAQPDFIRCETKQFWRELDRGTQTSKAEHKTNWAKLIRYLAEALETVLWVLAGGAGLWLAVYLYRWLKLLDWRRPSLGQRRALPDQVLGLDVRPESLPADISGEAWRLWRTGAAEAALSLLYRGALAALALREVPLTASATENDCLAQVAHTQPTELATFFTELTQAWLHTAYAHRRLDDTQVHHLCAAWPQHFSAA